MRKKKRFEDETVWAETDASRARALHPDAEVATLPTEVSAIEPEVPAVEEVATFEAAIEAVRVFLNALNPLVTALKPHLRALSAKQRQSLGTTREDYRRAMPMIAFIGRTDSMSGMAARSDIVDAGRMTEEIMTRAAIPVTIVKNMLEDTGRLAMRDGWTNASVIYAAAQIVAKRDNGISMSVKAVKAILKKGKHVDSAARRVGLTQHNASKAAGRLERSRRKATVALRAQRRIEEALADKQPPEGGYTGRNTGGGEDEGNGR